MLELKQVTFVYPRASAPAVRDASVRVAPGERVAVVGANGSGKSTLAKLAGGIIAAQRGRILVDGAVMGASGQGAALQVGLVGQDPAAQLVCPIVRDEVAFGPQCLGLPHGEVTRRAEEAMDQCGLTHLSEHEVRTLSSGQQQLLALAGVLAMRPAYLVLDEACAHLDQPSRQAVAGVVNQLLAKGTGILQITHDLREVAGADWVVEMSAGVVAWAGSSSSWSERRRASSTGEAVGARELPACLHGDKRDLALHSVTVSYDGAVALSDVTLTLRAGTLTLLVGPSGSGKTTLSRVAAGLVRPASGSVMLGNAAVLPGDVGITLARASRQLFAATIVDDVAVAPRGAGKDEGLVAKIAGEAMRATGVAASLMERSPFEVSGGEQQRVALAGVLASAPHAYVFDEPTAHLDAGGAADIRALVSSMVADGMTVMVATHDADAWLGVATHVVALDGGRVAFAGTVDQYAGAAGAMVLAGITSDAHQCVDGEGPRSFGVPVHVTRDATKSAGRISSGAKVMALLAFSALMLGMTDARVILGGALLAAVALVGVGGLGAVARALAASAVIVLFVLLGSIVVVDGSADVALLGTIGLRSGGVMRGVVASLRIVALMEAASVLARTTDAGSLADAVCAPVRRLPGGGAPALALQVAITMMPQVGDAFLASADAMRARGICLDGGSAVKRLRAYAAVLVPTVVLSFMRADEIATAMVARGYVAGGRGGGRARD